MALIKTAEEIKKLREGGRRLAGVLTAVAEAVCPGVSGRELDAIAEKLIREGGDEPAFKNYRPDGSSRVFPATLCVSVNDQVVHGIPTNRSLEEGDIVGLDLGIRHQGLYADMALTVPVGKISAEDTQLIKVTKEALRLGIEAISPGGHIGDIGAVIEKYVKQYGYGIVRELGGHGVGHSVHEHPYIPNFGKAGKGVEFEVGMVLAIEPMITRGGHAVHLGDDNFVFVTADHSRSAHFEHTVVVTEEGSEILTK